jgi:hypothetical protein
MSRWADAFAALSEGADTLDTLRHSDEPLATVSQSVNTVMAPAQGISTIPASDHSDTVPPVASTENAAKTSKPELESTQDLAGLATLAGVPTDDRALPGSDGEYSQSRSSLMNAVLENDDQTSEAAKAAKVAKDEGSAAVDRTLRCDPFDAIQPDDGNAPQSEPRLISPASWFERRAPPAAGEPSYDQPCPARRGRVKREGDALLHFCVTCGAWGAFGYGVFGDRSGRWYCFDHRPSG